MAEFFKLQEIEDKLINIRNNLVLLNSDVAMLYGVETMRINEAVKNNQDKFPDGYIITLTKEEKKELIENFDNPKLKFSPALPKAFTERGLYMLATILKSQQATLTTIAIVETFAKIRELSRNVTELAETKKNKSTQKSLMQKSGKIMTDILGEDFNTSDMETSIELNFAVLNSNIQSNVKIHKYMKIIYYSKNKN